MKYIILLFLGVLLFACEEEKLDIDKFGSVTGKILDGETYNPISGVQIVTNPASSSEITNEDGVFEFKKVIEGELAVTARKKDYLSNTVSIAVYNNEITSLTFFLLKDESDIGWVTIYDPVPGNGAVDQSTTLTMQWNVDQEYNSKELEYTVYYFEANSTTQKTAGENLSTEEVIINGLQYNTTYYWYVVAKYEGSRVANSPTWSFRTQSNN